MHSTKSQVACLCFRLHLNVQGDKDVPIILECIIWKIFNPGRDLIPPLMERQTNPVNENVEQISLSHILAQLPTNLEKIKTKSE